MKRLTALIRRFSYASFILLLINISFCALDLTTEGNINIYAETPSRGVTISLNGNVGIGVLSPSMKLEVAGTLSANNGMVIGTLNVAGLSTFSDVSINTRLSIDAVPYITHFILNPGNLSVNGVTSVNALSVGNVTINGGLYVVGQTTMTSLTLNGILSASAIEVVGAAIVGGLTTNGTVSANLFVGSGERLRDVPLSYYEVYDGAATAAKTAASGVTVMTSMTLSPPAGTYFAMFNGSFHHSTSAAITTFNICANGVTVDNSIRTIGAEAIANDRVTVQTSGFATVSAGQAIDVRWSTTANSATGYNRGLYLMRVR